MAVRPYFYAKKGEKMEKKFLEDLGLTEEQVTKILSQHTSEMEIATLKFKAKEFKLEDGKFLGADDFMKQYKEEHKALFKEEPKQEPDAPPMPQIVKPTGGSDGGEQQNKFNFLNMFTPVRKVEK